ncbi:hypothetical protein [Streptomyces sp. 049-1]|uniref:hypothetical protein n=1 Tax=Streptomyces sp. 049-1 TaxID=2789264 RepID=UPI0039802E19
MSPGEEANQPTEVGRTVPGAGADGHTPGHASRESRPVAHFAVVIWADGSATIDGEAVRAAHGEQVDAAVLRTLHGYARDWGATVTAGISDPVAQYEALVEIAPDGSSRLLGQRLDQRSEDDEDFGESWEDAPWTDPGEGLPGDFDDLADEFDDAPGSGNRERYDPIEDDGFDDRREEFGHEPDDGFGDTDEDEEDAWNHLADRRVRAPARAAVKDPDHGYDEKTDEKFAYQDFREEAVDSSYDLSQEPEDGTSPPSGRDWKKYGLRRKERRQSDEAFEPQGLLDRPPLVRAGAIIVVTLVVISLLILGRNGPHGGDKHEEESRARSGASPTAQGASPSVSHSSSEVPDEPDSQTAVNHEPPSPRTDDPSEKTAGDAVNQLSARDGSARHICYRVFYKERGWQDPVCDGAAAGAPGGGQLITSINIAVHGAGGSAANARVRVPGSADGKGAWEPYWTAEIADGKDNYVGSTAPAAPELIGFALNVGQGQVCQTARVHGTDWSEKHCAGPRPAFISGGTPENDLPLEAVKFTL